MMQMNGMLGKLGEGMCRLSINGDIAVKTPNGYKSYNVKTGKLVNCDNFVFDIGEEFFFVIPTSKVKKGDIILVNGKPKCVVEPGKNEIKVINYIDSTMETIIPERHVFMGNVYMYGKIVSMFGSAFGNSNKKGSNKIMKYMMLSSMLKNSNSTSSMFGDMSSMMPMMLMSGGNFNDMFDGLFDFDIDDEDEDEVDVESVEEEEYGIRFLEL